MEKQPKKVKKAEEPKGFRLLTLLPKVNHCIMIKISYLDEVISLNIPLTRSDKERLKRLPKKSASLLEKVGKMKTINLALVPLCPEPGLILNFTDELKDNSNATEIVLKEFRDVTKIDISDVQIAIMSIVPFMIWVPVE